jgi:hypothetical protein
LRVSISKGRAFFKNFDRFSCLLGDEVKISNFLFFKELFLKIKTSLESALFIVAATSVPSSRSTGRSFQE